jgi:peroxiredoxin
MDRRSYAVTLALTLTVIGAGLGQDSTKPRVGEAKPTWKALSGTDGSPHSLSDLSDKQVVVVAITCNHCPIAIEYFDRLKEFSNKYCGRDGRVALVAISVSNMETDKLPRMTEIAKEKDFNFQYLHDETQRVAKELGATVTPQFFVLNQDRVLVYRGAWDDSVNESKRKSAYVEDAVQALLSGRKPSIAETRTLGCSIKFKNS